MSLLLCSYASEKSRPEKIRAWISHLEQLQRERAETPEQRESVEILLAKAKQWIND